ncbi:hypothetical protein POM88_002667 [Heracleum sosnowskyi]|uniref:NLP1-9 GAF domain-containing protein n=1 Tax=Heracleum sosnowskyi TaxID=360622 RepID=A0AAD8JID3_9APIA|nr:hypothetical protein POM88_002667 [Heracleum sosnowskyi]
MDFSSNGQRNDHDAIQWRISSYLDSFFVLYGLGPKRQKSQNLLIQFWAATNHTSEDGTKCCVLATKDQPYDLIFSDQGFSSYRNYSVACNITVQDYEMQQNHKKLSVPGRVYRNKMPEITPDISYHSVDDYTNRDFSLSCGIRTSICLPIFEYNYGCRNGVLELVSTSDDLELLMNHIYSSYSYSGLKMITQVKHPFRLNLQDLDIPLCASKEIDHVLGVVCQEFGVPLAHCWVIGNLDFCTSDHLRGTTEALVVTNCATSMHYESLTSWCEFKRACWQMCMRKDQGIVGKAFLSHKPFFCRDITQFSMTKYPLAHFARKCGTMACFTICLHSFITGNIDYVLEFFLPHEKISSSHPQTLLKALLATLKEQFQTFVENTLNMKAESPRQCMAMGNGQLTVEDDPRQNKDVLDAEKDSSSTQIYGITGIKEISGRKIDNAAAIIDLDELGEGLSVEFIECNEPQSFSSQAKRSLPRKQMYPSKECIEIERERMELDPSNKHMLMQDTLHQKGFRTEKEERSIHGKRNSFESLSEHFGRPLADAAKSFNGKFF